MTTVDIIKPFFFIVFLLIEIKPLSKTLSLNLFFCFVLFKRECVGGANYECNFPLSSGVFPITVPPCKGTHGDRVAGDNTRSRHNLRHFSYCATSLCAPATQQHGAVACTLRQVRRSIRSPPCGSNSVFEVAQSVYKCAPNRLSVCGKRAALRQVCRKVGSLRLRFVAKVARSASCLCHCTAPLSMFVDCSCAHALRA